MAPHSDSFPKLRSAVTAPAYASAVGLTLILVVCAPLAVGTVHRPAIVASTLTAAAALGAFLLATWGSKRSFRGGRLAVPLVVLVGLPLLQIIPLPLWLRGVFDPAGNELLTNAAPPIPTNFALSLDPSTTQVEVLRAALALTVFIITLNLSCGRHAKGAVITKAVACSAVLGVLISIVHPLMNVDLVYGFFGKGGSPTLVGPFVNPNHTAEFFELGAFAAVASAFFATDRLLRAAWLAAAALCGAAALLTLSRGSLVGLMSGVLVLLVLLPRSRSTHDAQSINPGWRRAFTQIAAVLCLTAGLAFALGAAPLLDEVARTRLSHAGEKTELWFDSFNVLLAHPAGVGRGAFDRVYPAYRTLPGSTHPNFIENEPLQMLVDLGWLGFCVLLASLAYLVLMVRRRRLQDRPEAALIAGLVAIIAHNFFDFGLETLGVRLPFVALLGVMVGRISGRRAHSKAKPATTTMPLGLVGIGLCVGLWGLLRMRPFDQMLASASSSAARATIAVAASHVHPTDYFFPLVQASSEPLRGNGRSPRLSTLNRSLRLCPNCSNVHRAVATTLWQLGRTRQALVEYRIAIDLDVAGTDEVVDDLYEIGATHEEVATVHPQSPKAAQLIATGLISRQAKGAAPREALAHAMSRSADPFELGLLRVQLALNEGDNATASAEVERLIEIEPRSARALYLQIMLLEGNGQGKAALKEAALASGYNPTNLTLARQRVSLAARLEEWGEFERALDVLKGALQSGGGNLSEAYLVSGEAFSRRGNLPRAIRDFETATSIEPGNATAWYALGITAEHSGFYTRAEDAYRSLLQLQPQHREARAGLARIEAVRRNSGPDVFNAHSVERVQ